jgi:hypothetical protein
LQQLDLSGNNIREIPTNLGSLAQLELINLESSPVNGTSLLSLRKSLPFAYIKYLSTELGMNFESKPIDNSFHREFETLEKKCSSGDANACYQLAQFFEKRKDYGLAFKLYYNIAENLTRAGSAQNALAYLKIADLYNDKKNEYSYNSVYKRRKYNDYDDYTNNIKNNRSLDIYCKVCEFKPNDKDADKLIKRSCASAALIYNETIDNLKEIFAYNKSEIERLIGGAGDMANVSSVGKSIVNTSTTSSSALIGGGLSIFGKVSQQSKESKSEKKQKENDRLKQDIENLYQKVQYYLNKGK